jgi:aspartyl-tRNA(Asn)/glutamyl-tRNA(Gln) amidotransferase subunit A
VGWVAALGYGRVDDEIAALCQAATRRLAGEGAQVQVLQAPLFDADPHTAWNEVFYGAIGARIRQQAGDDLSMADIDPGLRRVLLQRQPLPPGQVTALRQASLQRVLDAFEQVDVLALPTTPVTAPPAGTDVPPGHEGRNPVDWSYFTYPFNLSGHPAVSLPVGLASDGMPVGLQLVGRLGEEHTLLAAAAAVARSSPMPRLP